jgi:ubiquinone biosynthesis protein
LLQKTMVQIEGLGRRLDPKVNIWALARPLIEAWMRENRGPEAILQQRFETLAEVIEGVPRLMRSLEALIGDWSREGVVMHAETLAVQAAKRARHLAILLVPVWAITASLVAIALALVFRR